MKYKFTESEVEEAALQWFSEEGYEILNGMEIAPGEPAAERYEYSSPFLNTRLRDALFLINRDLPDSAVECILRPTLNSMTAHFVHLDR